MKHEEHLCGPYTNSTHLSETLDDELPHSLAVVVDSIDYPEDNETGQGYDGKAQVNVSIYVERDSQKPIIIGPVGSKSPSSPITTASVETKRRPSSKAR